MQRNMVGVWLNVGYRLDHRWPAPLNVPKPSHLLSWDRKSGRETRAKQLQLLTKRSRFSIAGFSGANIVWDSQLVTIIEPLDYS